MVSHQPLRNAQLLRVYSLDMNPMTHCPVASRIFHDWSEALREAFSPEHRDSEELLTSYAGAVASALDRHLQECPVCNPKEPTQ